MAELLVRVADKINADFYLNCQCTKRGDVIVIQPDGWSWGKEELTTPDWQIVKLPGIEPSDLSGFLAPELNSDPQHPSKTLQRRAFKFDLTKLSTAFPTQTAKFAGVVRTAPSVVLLFDLSTTLTYQFQKAPITDPTIIGTSPNIL